MLPLFGFDPTPKYKMAGVLVLQIAIARSVASAPLGRGARVALLLVAAYAIGAIANH